MKILPLHSWNLTPKEAVQLQHQLGNKINLRCSFQEITLVAGADISYSKRDPHIYAAVVVIDIQTMQVIEVQQVKGKAAFPYIPGLLAFRELPVLCEVFEKIESKIDAVLCDGQGIAHPRKFGLACHLGLLLDIPTVGCAKTKLVGEFKPMSKKQWASSPLIYKDEIRGEVVRSRANVKPLFISPGHKMDIESSIALVKKCTTRYRIPEPTRLAHLYVNRMRRENSIAHQQNIHGIVQSNYP